MLRRIVKAILAERGRPLLSRCAYCGEPCYGRACKEHRDLIQLDPGMGASR
jgi:hypothetical protein